jgi:hypothetical protein
MWASASAATERRLHLLDPGQDARLRRPDEGGLDFILCPAGGNRRIR